MIGRDRTLVCDKKKGDGTDEDEEGWKTDKGKMD